MAERKDKDQLIKELSSLTHSEVNAGVKALDKDQLNDVWELVEAVLKKERAGLDSLFSVMTHTMKFIPNLLLVSLTSRYIEPPIAARICAYLTIKQSVSIANGLDAEYVAESSRYMTPQLSVDLLIKMKPKHAKHAIECLRTIDEFVFESLKEELAVRGVQGWF